jgi:hypothetical protein
MRIVHAQQEPTKRLLGMLGQLVFPLAQHEGMNSQILLHLADTDPRFGHRLYCLDLEFPRVPLTFPRR